MIPTTLKTAGDYIRFGRYEKSLHLAETAAKLNISGPLLSAWENDTKTPDSKQWKALAAVLNLPAAVLEQANPT